MYAISDSCALGVLAGINVIIEQGASQPTFDSILPLSVYWSKCQLVENALLLDGWHLRDWGFKSVVMCALESFCLLVAWTDG